MLQGYGSRRHYEGATPTPTNLIEQLTRDEGLRLTPYRDSVGKLTIGIGRNLTDVGISRDEAEYLLSNDIHRTIVELNQALPSLSLIDEIRRNALYNMAFNLGVKGLLGFTNTLALLQQRKYSEAAEEMLKSKWANQVGVRAQRLAEQIKTGEWQ
jgi:lysozyme